MRERANGRENRGMSHSRGISAGSIAVDLAATAAILAGVTSPLLGRGDWAVGAPVIGLAVAAGIVLAFRRRFPQAALLLTSLLTLALMAFGVSGPVIGLPVAIAIYAVTLRLPRRRGLTVSAIATAVLTAGLMLMAQVEVYEPAWIAFLAVAALAAAWGSYSRSRRELLRASEARARAAEETKETEARQRVAEDRLRIARDLHDVVAHQVAAVSLHAELAEADLTRDPEQARASLAIIKQSAKETLREISALMKVLRETSDLLPNPSLRAMSELLERARVSGLRVAVTTRGDLVDLPPNVDAVAYRVLQEGLTNVTKHSRDGSATLLLERDDQRLVLELTNPSASRAPSDSGGHGLQGMRERIASVGGEMTVVRDEDGAFHLRVALPLHRAEAA